MSSGVEESKTGVEDAVVDRGMGRVVGSGPGRVADGGIGRVGEALARCFW